MALLLVGLVLFLGVHSIRAFAPDWRLFMIEQLGDRSWKMLHGVVALIGFFTIVMGYGYARYSAEWLWIPPVWTRHLSALLVLIAFVYFAAAAMPYSKIKQRIGYPMVVGIKLWALAHLISNGTTADLILFGSFLCWSVWNFITSRRQDKKAGREYIRAPNMKYDFLAIILGAIVYVVFALYLHAFLIGVAPFSV